MKVKLKIGDYFGQSQTVSASNDGSVRVALRSLWVLQGDGTFKEIPDQYTVEEGTTVRGVFSVKADAEGLMDGLSTTNAANIVAELGPNEDGEGNQRVEAVGPSNTLEAVPKVTSAKAAPLTKSATDKALPATLPPGKTESTVVPPKRNRPSR